MFPVFLSNCTRKSGSQNLNSRLAEIARIEAARKAEEERRMGFKDRVLGQLARMEDKIDTKLGRFNH